MERSIAMNKKQNGDDSIKISLFFAISMVLQMVTAIWWASSLTTRVDSLEQWVSHNHGLPAYMQRLDERTQAIKQTLEHIEHKLSN